MNNTLTKSIMLSLAPQKCVICDAFFLGIGACKVCFSMLEATVPPRCDGCGIKICSAHDHEICLNCQMTTAIFNQYWSAFSYSPVAGAMIQRAKNSGLPTLLDMLLRRIPQKTLMALNGTFDVIIPIPDRLGRYVQRGFSPAGLVSKHIEKHTASSEVIDALAWRKQTPRQALLTRLGRRKNMVNAFRAKDIAGRRCLLVDDVRTTGSTLASAAKALHEADAAEVSAFVVCAKDS